ncbi:MAG: hypothetical protein WBA16_00615 [Nonlabens sp.]
MRLNFKFLVGVFLIIQGVIYAQKNDSIASDFYIKKSFTLEVHYRQGIPVGDNFASNGLEGGSGGGMRLHMFPYRNFYAGAGFGWNNYSVVDRSLLGSYSESDRFEGYLYVGYDYVINQKWNAGIDLSLGTANFRNTQELIDGNGDFQERGELYRLGLSIEYALNNSFGVYLSPNYTFMNMQFRDLAPQIAGQFENASFFDFTIGIRYTVRNKRYYENK